jgi:hypothetical protein
MSEATQRFFTKHSVREHKENMMNRNLDKLSPEVQEYIKKKIADRKGDVKLYSDDNPTPNQEGADYELKQWIEAHPDWTKYIAELGAKWGNDKILEGLEHDMNEGKTE